MLKKINKRLPEPDVIPQPPLIMDHVHAKGEHVSEVVLATSKKNISLQFIPGKEQVEPQVIMKLIQYLEQKS